jgi:transcriptional regulator with XRE-family HTH domain
MADKKRHFDLQGFYRTVDATRAARGLNWKEVAAVAGVSASTLTRMAQEQRPDADSLTALAAWAGLNPVDFLAEPHRAYGMEPLAAISQTLQRDPNLTVEDAEVLEEMIKAAYQRMAKRKKL